MMSTMLGILLTCIVILSVFLLYHRQQSQQKRYIEKYTNPTPMVHYYWIVSEKRKPLMLQQLRDRKNGIKEEDVTFVKGIFSDDVSKTNHPDLPKEWLGFPIARLLAAHMQAIRMFQSKISSLPDKKKHVFVCLEDDVVLHKDFEKMVAKSTEFLHSQQGPLRLSLGYANPPSNITFIESVSDSVGNLKFSKLNIKAGDPWGTQSYMLNSEFVDTVLQKYDNAYRTQPPIESNIASDVFIYDIPETQHYIIEPPACIEDFPTFGSMLGHNGNASLYNQMVNKYDRSQYYYSFTQLSK